METTTLTATEALLALSTSLHITEVMRTAINNVLKEHAEMLGMLVHIEQAYSKPHSPPERAAALNVARGMIARIKGR